jgi:hypothetical protein
VSADCDESDGAVRDRSVPAIGDRKVIIGQVARQYGELIMEQIELKGTHFEQGEPS